MTMTAAQQRRDDWMTDIFAPINAWHEENGSVQPPIELVDAAIDRVIAEGPALGKTDRWQGAVAFFAHEKAQEASERHRRWLLFQGGVYLGHANF